MTSPTPIQTQPRSRLTKRQGISIVIAMLMVMAFMLTMADLMQAMNRSKIITESGWNADQARANAELGLSLGIMSQTNPTAYQQAIKSQKQRNNTVDSMDLTKNVMTLNSIGPGNTVQWKVVDVIGGDKAGQACNKVEPKDAAQTKNDCSSYYFVYPFPGSGTVGGGRCDASKISTVKDEKWYEDMYFYMFGEESPSNDLIGKMVGSPDGKILSLKTATTNMTALDHPCMWNNLGKGVSAEIPLYRKIPNANGDPTTLGMDNIENFWLRVRLPCKGGTACGSADRYKIDPQALSDPNNLSSPKVQYYNLLHWNIQSKCKVDDGNGKKDNLCYISDVNANTLAAIIPATPNGPTEGKDLAEAIGDMGPPILKNMTFNKNDSAITYQRLANASSDFSKAFDLTDTVLSFVTKTNKPLYIRDGSSEINYGKFKDFFDRLPPWNFIKEITNPLFRLSIASELITTEKVSNKNIKTDHIEYQLLYKPTNNGTTPIITNPVVTATGSSNGYDITLEKSVLKHGGAYNYPIIGK